MKRMVFDDLLWKRNGGDSDTDDFFRPAKIIAMQGRDGGDTATVQFQHDGRISQGHFLSAMRKIPGG